MKPASHQPPSVARPWFIPLYARVLMLFFLNVLLVAGGMFWVLQHMFELDRQLLVDRAARERLEQLGQKLHEELTTQPEAHWEEFMRQQGTLHHAELAVYSVEPARLAGAPLVLPPRLMDSLPKPELRHPGGPRPRPREDEDHDGPPRPPLPGETSPLPKGHQFLIQAFAANGAYWLSTRLPPIRKLGPPDRAPTLVARIASLGVSPLLFNPKPWLYAGLGTVIVSAVLWLPLVRQLTNSLSQMKKATAQIAQGNFSIRLQTQRRDELGQLGTAINAMSGRLEGFVYGQKRFLGDIAHELCSPLARMEMALAILEQKAPTELTERLNDVREEVREMSELVSELLSYAKAGFAGVNSLREVVSLGSVVEAAIAREARGAAVNVELLELTEVVAVPSLLGRALGNLLRNAVRYAGSSGAIEITAHRSGELVEICIADQGPGVPDADLLKLFDPFFRSDLSRTRETGGVGLGLAIVKACIDACGGTVTAANQLTGGLAITIALQSVSAE